MRNLGEPIVLGRCFEPVRGKGLYRRVRDITDIRVAVVESGRPLSVDIDTENVESSVGKRDSESQTHFSESDDAEGFVRSHPEWHTDATWLYMV